MQICPKNLEVNMFHIVDKIIMITTISIVIKIAITPSPKASIRTLVIFFLPDNESYLVKINRAY